MHNDFKPVAPGWMIVDTATLDRHHLVGWSTSDGWMHSQPVIAIEGAVKEWRFVFGAGSYLVRPAKGLLGSDA